MKTLYTAVLLLFCFQVEAFQPEDSSVVVEKKKKGSITITSRVHTMGLFLYMGKVVNHNPATDIYFNYTTNKGWSISAFKAVDVNDIHSGNNFAFLFLSKAFHVTDKLTVAPYVGTGLEQQHSFANHGSDVMLQFYSSYRFNKRITVEYIGIFNNLIFATEHQDWTNRFRLIFTDGHWDLIGMFWNNTGVIDGTTYTSGGMSVFYNRVPVAKRLYLGAGITSLSTFQSSDEEHVARQAGLQFSTTLTFK